MLLIGGKGWQKSGSEEVVLPVKATLQKGKLVGGICDGSASLEFAVLIFNKLRLDTEQMIKEWYDSINSEQLRQEKSGSNM